VVPFPGLFCYRCTEKRVSSSRNQPNISQR
jgi:hypothetical protein